MFEAPWFRLVLPAAITLFTACGAPSTTGLSDSDPQIVGGKMVPADQNDPRRWSTVALTTDYRKSADRPSLVESGRSFCTGTILSENVILTAAHCVVPFDPATKTKKAGFNLPKETDFLVHFGNRVTHSGTWIRAAKVLPHKEWDPAQTLNPKPTKPANDIALIVLSQPIPAGYKPVGLIPNNHVILKKEKVHLAGFGVSKSRKDNDTGVLRQVAVALKSSDSALARFTVGNFLHGACAGDSGGPAYYQDSAGRWWVWGVTSTGAELFGRCLGLINNYTDARYYKSWISETLRAI